jgi:cytochrome b561
VTAAASPRAYGSTSKALHWLTAGLVAAQITLALRAWKLPPGSVKSALLGEHMSFGFCVLLLTLLRLAWRRRHPIPGLPDSVGPGQRRAARVNQAVLYSLLLLLPLSGWSMVSAAGIAPTLFGVVPIPALHAVDPAFHGSLKLVHLALNTLLFAALLLHVAAALRHGLRRDGVLTRMLPRFGGGSGA